MGKFTQNVYGIKWVKMFYCLILLRFMRWRDKGGKGDSSMEHMAWGIEHRIKRHETGENFL